MRFIFTVVVFFCYAPCAVLLAQGWQWGRGNTGTGIDGWAVATDPSGNVFAAGINFGIYPVSLGPLTIPDAGPGSFQCVLVKYDPNGNVLWANASQNGDACLISIAADVSGNSLMFGSFKSASIQFGSHTLLNPVFPNAQYFLVKYDPSGNVLWAVNTGNAQFNYAILGGIAVVLGTGGVATDASGYIYVTANFHVPTVTIGGTTLTNADPSGLTNDILLVKYDPAGNVVWARSAGGPGNDEAYGITVTPAGDIYICGVFGSPSLVFGANTISNTSAGAVAFVARYDPTGSSSWACSSGGNGKEYAVGLASDLSNNVYLTGGLKDKSISFGGMTITNPDTVPVLYLVKFDPGNSADWYKTIGPATDTGLGAWGYSIAVSQCGVVWVSGCMNGPVTIDGRILPVPPLSTDPIFMAAFTSSGTYSGSVALQSGGDDQNGIACDGSGNVFMCSDYETYPFSIASDTFPEPTITSGELLFVAKYATGNSAYKNAVCSKTDLCLVNFVTLEAHPGYTNYLWGDGRVGASRTVTDTGVFWVLGFDSCTNSTIDTFKVTTSCDCQKALFIPNAFTPNGDGQDDVFYPRCGANVQKIKTFQVYNRWGELLFDRQNLDPNDAGNAWDGTFKGSLPVPDVYVWVVEAICENGSQVNKKGSVTVIR